MINKQIENKAENKKIPPETIEVIASLVEKYDLGPTDIFNESGELNEQLKEIFQKTKNSQEAIKRIKELPFEKIYQATQNFIQGKIVNFEKYLREKIGLPPEISTVFDRRIKESLNMSPAFKKESNKIISDRYREPIE